MDDVGIVEAAHDMGDDSDFADVGQKLVAKTFALGGTCHKTCDVHELNNSRNHLCRRNQADDLIKSRIGNVDNSDVRFDCAERIVGSICRGTCECRENGGFSYVRKSYNTAIKSHYVSPDFRIISSFELL